VTTDKPLIVDMVIPDMDSASGGPTVVVKNIAAELSANHQLNVVAGSIPDSEAEISVIAHHVASGESFFARTFQKKVKQLLRETNPDIVHSHGLWRAFNKAFTQESLVRKIPLIIQPHGMLDPWALSHKRIKKLIAYHVFQKRLLSRADLLVANSHLEMENMRKLGFKNPIALIPNGIDLPDVQAVNSLAKEPPSEKKKLVFIGRLHPVKGLVELIKAFATISQSNPDWQLVIAGSGSPSFTKQLQQLVKRLKMSDAVIFTGFLKGDEKWKLLLGASLFVAPSHSESFGVSILEALSMGVPVVTTNNTPWSEIRTRDCGWICDVGMKPLVEVLSEALNTSDESLHSKGLNALAFSKNFSWPKIAEMIDTSYHWVLNKSDKPSFIYEGE